MIEISHLYKSYGKNSVLCDVITNIKKGEITVIAGPNGSGKTTLIKSILGLVSIDNGEILVDGSNVRYDYKYRELIGYMPQIGRFPDNQTTTEIIKMIKDLREKDAHGFVEKLIEVFELQEHLNKKMSTLSGGTRQKVSAVLAFMFEPPILILDEPTTGLDPISAAKIKDMILAEKRAGKTIIIISHIMSEVEELADKLIFLLDGKIRFQDEVNVLLTQSGESSLERAIAKFIQQSGN